VIFTGDSRKRFTIKRANARFYASSHQQAQAGACSYLSGKLPASAIPERENSALGGVEFLTRRVAKSWAEKPRS
jgi:hypothetical protein